MVLCQEKVQVKHEFFIISLPRNKLTNIFI